MRWPSVIADVTIKRQSRVRIWSLLAHGNLCQFLGWLPLATYIRPSAVSWPLRAGMAEVQKIHKILKNEKEKNNAQRCHISRFWNHGT
jgi:hypothetical protein